MKFHEPGPSQARKRGRPRKHATEDDRKRAQKAARAAYNQRQAHTKRAGQDARAPPPAATCISHSPLASTTHRRDESSNEGINATVFASDDATRGELDQDIVIPCCPQSESNATSATTDEASHVALRPAGSSPKPAAYASSFHDEDYDDDDNGGGGDEDEGFPFSGSAGDGASSLPHHHTQSAPRSPIGRETPAFPSRTPRVCPTPALPNDGGGDTDNTAARLAMADMLISWLRGLIGCSLGQHTAMQDEHAATHHADDAHPHRHSLEDITHTLQNQPTDTATAQGSTTMQTRHGRQGCLIQNTAEARPFATSFDIDSITGFASTLAFVKTGWRAGTICWCIFSFLGSTARGPRWRRGRNGANGDDDNGASNESSRQRQQLPKRASQLHQTILTAAQYAAWYERVFLPALVQATAVQGPDGVLQAGPNYAAYLPKSYKMAQGMTYAKSEERRTGVSLSDGGDSGSIREDTYRAGNEPTRQQVTHYLAAESVQTLAEHMRAIIAGDPDLSRVIARGMTNRYGPYWSRAEGHVSIYLYNLHLFDGFVFYFSAKNLKSMYIRSVPAFDTAAVDTAFHATAESFAAHWERLIDDQHLDPDHVYVDLAKQHMPFGDRRDGLETGPDRADRQPSTFLFRSCCLETVCNEYRDWVDRFAGRRAGGGKNSQGSRNNEDAQQTEDTQCRRQNDINRGRFVYQRPVPNVHQYPPTVTRYPWALTRDAGDATIAPAKNGPDFRVGLAYTQFYNIIKTPFDAQKIYALQGPNLETLAFDQLYLKSLQQATQAIAALGSTALATAAYQRGKERALESLVASSTTCFGGRQEHRITLTLFRTIQARWSSITPAKPAQAHTHTHTHMLAGSAIAPPWFAIPSQTVFSFSYEQINRHCYGLERGRMRAGKLYSLNDTAAMVVMLRMFHYCYCSRLLQNKDTADPAQQPPQEWTQEARQTAGDQDEVSSHGEESTDSGGRKGSEGAEVMEDVCSLVNDSDDGSEWQDDGPLLFDSDEDDPGTEDDGHGAEALHDGIEPKDGQDGQDAEDDGEQLVQGLGLYASMERGGFGWWQPKRFDWDYWVLDEQIVRLYARKQLYANGRMYKRQMAIAKTDSVYRKANLAENLFTQNRLGGQQAEEGQQLWLDLLCFLVIRQFDLDVWQAMLKEHTRFLELTPEAVRRHGPSNPPVFCWSAMSRLFYDRRGPHDNAGPPWFLVGRGTAWKDTYTLLQHLFEWRDGVTRKGWAAKPYRVLTQRLHSIVENRMGGRWAALWLRRLQRLITLTHWVLPSPRSSGFFNRSEVRYRHLRRVLWYSSVYQCSAMDDRRDEFSADANTTRQQYQAGERRLRARGPWFGWCGLEDTPDGYRFVAYSTNTLQTKMEPYGAIQATAGRPPSLLSVRDFRRQEVWEDLNLVIRHGAYKDDKNRDHWVLGRDGEYPVVEIGTPPAFLLSTVVQRKETEVEAWFRSEVQRMSLSTRPQPDTPPTLPRHTPSTGSISSQASTRPFLSSSPLPDIAAFLPSSSPRSHSTGYS
ncbi:hypothetical protein SPI_06116 [Niveomyces insectorum RCEF 264]|uniref:Uncharacterized protein n=1 Tax=Niveomyces insectorum RCEF 264 TaxID=1081102 RepID=A0A167RT81_9HYPO|nr:hypothetical protein SPI_06116 [Niveomyces insectorum RCEF 264]